MNSKSSDPWLCLSCHLSCTDESCVVTGLLPTSTSAFGHNNKVPPASPFKYYFEKYIRTSQQCCCLSASFFSCLGSPPWMLTGLPPNEPRHSSWLDGLGSAVESLMRQILHTIGCVR